jgi:hypothetical protein
MQSTDQRHVTHTDRGRGADIPRRRMDTVRE